ncbi:MAG: caspase family protein [Bacteroidia bacterium]
MRIIFTPTLFLLFISAFGQEPRLILPIGHTSVVTCASFSPDGKYIVTSSFDETAKIWSTETGQLLLDLKGQTSIVNSASFSPDGKKIVTSSDDNTSKIWDAENGKMLLELKGHTDDVNSANFSADGKKIVTASDDQTTRIWNTENGKLLLELKQFFGDVNSASFSSDGKKIITVSNFRTIVWSAKNGQRLLTINDFTTSASFSTEGKKIVTSHGNTTKIWNAENGQLLLELKEKTDWVNSASFSPDGKKIVTGSKDHTAKVWDAENGQLLFELRGHTDEVKTASFSLDGKKIVTSSFDKTAKVWSSENGQLLLDLKGHTDYVSSAKFSADGKKIISTYNNSVKVWNTENGQLLLDLKGHSNLTTSSSFSNDGKKIVTSSWDKTAKVWSAETGQFLLELKGHIAHVNSANFSADGGKIVTSSDDETAKVWDGENGQMLLELKGHDASVNFAMFSTDGKKIITASHDRTAKVWSAENGQMLLELKGHNDWVASASISSDGKKIVTSSWDHTAKVWNAETGQLILDLVGFTSNVTSASFSSDGKKIITVSDNDRKKIWSVETGQLLLDLKASSSGVNSAYFSREGEKIITTEGDNTIKLWDAITGNNLYTFFAVDSTDHLIIDPFNRYDGTEAARKLLYFTCGTEVISLEQLKDQLWVPHLAERINKGDSINAPKLSDLDICGLTPQVEDISEKGFYHFKITPRRGGLGETVLEVNGIETKKYKPEELVKSNGVYELKLSEESLQPYFKAGESNTVSLKCFTAKNNISSRGVQVTNTVIEKEKTFPNLYAVMVGVSDYKGEELDLKYAAKDAEDISNAIKISAGKLLNIDGKEHLFFYNLNTGANHYLLPEKKSIKNVFEEIGKKATPNDILLIFFAGHGVMEGEIKQFYFLTADASKETAVNAAAEVGISTTELSEWMKPDNIKAQKRILIFDACNSGQAINEIVKIGDPGQNYLAARSDDNALQIKAIDKLNEKSGLVILSASASNQSAYEMSRYSQGLLTYSLLKVMKQQPEILEENKYLNVSKWFSAAEKTVSDLIIETGARQQPQIVSTANFNIGVVDEEVVSKINLPQEKPIFIASSFQNKKESFDDMDLSKYINNELNDVSTRGAESPISFMSSTNLAEAYLLSGAYEIAGEMLKVSVDIRQNKKSKYHFEISGKKSEIKELAVKIVQRATEWIGKEGKSQK